MRAEKKLQNNPFVKNRYYSGKLLHASDFENEQKYHNEKLEFINRRFHGYGIIKGLDVRIDKDEGLVLEAGSALDRYGRIILCPSDRVIGPRDIEGLTELESQDFVLGIRYKEQCAGQERCFLKEEEKYYPSRIVETFSLKAYRLEECCSDKASEYSKRSILYENDLVRMAIEMPIIVPSDSIFRIKIRILALSGQKVSVRWGCMMKLQGGWFLETGRRHRRVHCEETAIEGNLQREWEICTDEGQELPVVLEVSGLEIVLDGHMRMYEEVFRFSIGTAKDYHEAVRNSGICGDISEECSETDAGDWLPVAYLQTERKQEGDVSFRLVSHKNVRILIRNSWETELLHDMMEESGIVDIRWRHLLKRIGSFAEAPLEEVPFPEGLFQEDPPSKSASSKEASSKGAIDREPPFGGGHMPRKDFPYGMEHGPDMPVLPDSVPAFRERQKEWVQELLKADRKERFRRGVAVISVPRRYKNGQVLLSEEISHSFPGEEVFLWCGRVWEEPNYAYWDRDKAKYSITQGAEYMFPQMNKSGWVIEGQAFCQDVDAGTFRIAVTLRKGRKRSREKEVAVSWIAVRAI